MRPIPDLPFSRISHDRPPSPSLDPRTATPASFFLSRNPHISDDESTTPLETPENAKETMYGVQSLEDTLSHSEFISPLCDQVANDSLKQTNVESHLAEHRSTLKPSNADTDEVPGHLSSTDEAYAPLTPLTLGIPDDPSSLPSSPKSISNQSLRPLDDISITDEINSEAVGSGDEEKPHGSPHLAPSGASQFIMPSIKMPSRRPFTERGKAMGRFKLLLAGSSGTFLFFSAILCR